MSTEILRFPSSISLIYGTVYPCWLRVPAGTDVAVSGTDEGLLPNAAARCHVDVTNVDGCVAVGHRRIPSF